MSKMPCLLPNLPACRAIGLSLLAICMGAAARAGWLGTEANIIVWAPASAPDAANLPGKLAAQCAGWRDSGLVENVRVFRTLAEKDPGFVKDRFALEEGWYAILAFKDESGLAKWQQVGQPALAAGAVALRVDRLMHSDNDQLRETPKGVFLYKIDVAKVSPEQYEEHAKGYLLPEYEGLLALHCARSISIYVPRDRANAPWSGLVLFEFTNAKSFAHWHETMEDVQKWLSYTPEWKKFADKKEATRDQRSITQAELVPLPPAAKK